MAFNNKICLIYNFAQHYRYGIFKLLNDDLNVDFYFGDKMDDVKKIDYNLLSNFQYELTNIRIFKKFYWQSGAVKVFFKKYNHYIILGDYYALSTWVILLLSTISNKRIYLWTHGWYGKENFFFRLIKKIFYRLGNSNIFLYGNYAKNLMVKEGFNPKFLHVIYNSLDYNKQLQIRSEIKIGKLYENIFCNNFPTLIFIGRLTKVKKLNLVLDAIKLLNEKKVEVNFLLIGEGEERFFLEEKVHQFNLDEKVKFTGAIYDEKLIAGYISHADVCVSPGNVGLTAMHSLVFGTPVISNDNFPYQMPEFEAIEEGLTGSFFKDGDILDLANKLNLWIERKDREVVRQNCYKRIDSFFNPNYQFKIIKNVIKANS